MLLLDKKKFRFQLAVSQVIGNIQLAYESQKDDWKRTKRVSDLKFKMGTIRWFN